MLAYFLLTVLPIAAVIYVVWAHRKRTAERVAASSKRYAEILGSASSPAAAPSSTPFAGGSPAAPASYLRKARLLDSQHRLLFCALASSLPEHEIFVHVSLAALVELPPAVQGREREQRSRVLAQSVVDCLVCNKEMEVIAAVDVEDGVNAQSRIKSDCLKAAQVRYLRVSPSALPGPDEVRMLLFGRGGEKSS